MQDTLCILCGAHHFLSQPHLTGRVALVVIPLENAWRVVILHYSSGLGGMSI